MGASLHHLRIHTATTGPFSSQKEKKKICSVQACNTLRIKTKNDSCVVRLTFQIVKFCSLTDAEAKVSEAVWDDLPSNQY